MVERKTVSQCISSDYCKGWNDAVNSVVRCKDCYKRNTVHCPLGDWTLPHDDDFCNYGSDKDVIMSDL